MRRVLCLFALFALLTPRLLGQAVATLRNGEVIEMRLSGVPLEDAQQFSQQYTVGPGGTINVPLIGEFKAAGLTAPELERALQSRFVARKIFTQPTVTINFAQGVRAVTVMGGVVNPGRVPWTVDLTLRSAIGACGDLDPFGASKGVQII